MLPAPFSARRLLAFVLGALLLGCGPAADWPEPPRTAALDQLDPAAQERILTALTAIEADRGAASAWAELGMIYDSERLRTLALECYDVAARIAPEEPRWPYRTAVTLARLGRTTEAIAAIERSLARDEHYAPSHYRLGLCQLEAGQLERAEAAFRRATELDATYPGGWIGRARVHLQRDENEAAIEILERLTGQQPGDASVTQLLSNAYRQAGRATEFDAAGVLGAEDVPVWNDPWELETRRFRRTPTMLLVSQALASGLPEEALRLLERARLEGADREETALPSASALLALGRLDEARAEAEGMLGREPKDTRAMMILVRIHQEHGEREAALGLLGQITALEPTYAGAWVARGGLEILLERAEDAVASLHQAIELGQGDPEVLQLLVSALVSAGHWAEARERLDSILRTRADDGNSWALLALARSRLGEVDGAEEALERARSTSPPASPSFLRKASLSIERKRKALARRAAAGEESDR